VFVSKGKIESNFLWEKEEGEDCRCILGRALAFKTGDEVIVNYIPPGTGQGGSAVNIFGIEKRERTRLRKREVTLDLIN